MGANNGNGRNNLKTSTGKRSEFYAPSVTGVAKYLLFEIKDERDFFRICDFVSERVALFELETLSLMRPENQYLLLKELT